MTATYWGNHFPDAAGATKYWSTHFPDGTPAAALWPGVGPAGAATFVLQLASGAKFTMSWVTDIVKTYSGKEYRSSLLDLPKIKVNGAAYLTGGTTRQQRARLARYAAIGSVFSLALPNEEMTLVADASSTTVFVNNTTTCDWMVVGQRVSVVDGSTTGGGSVDAVIQSFTSNTVVLDVAPGSFGRRGCRLMPRIPIYLDPQQGFVRYPTNDATEQWQLVGTAATFGFQSDARMAKAALSASSGALAATVIYYINTGPAGNTYSIAFVADGAGAGNVTIVGTAYTYHYQSGVTTMLAVLFNLASVFGFTGTFDPTAVLVAGDAIGPITLSGGADKVWGNMGVGATVNTYNSHPVWDRGIATNGSASDSLQSLSELVDLNGVPIAIGTADAADWGRAIAISRITAIEWQWIKAFLATVRGRQRAFWLATWRPDLVWVGVGGTDPITGGPYMVIQGPGDIYGGIDAWWPSQRNRLQVIQTDGTVTYAMINAVVDNGNGTLSLSLTLNTAMTGAAVSMLSWLDLCRFESDDFEFTFDADEFSLRAQARAVLQ